MSTPVIESLVTHAENEIARKELRSKLRNGFIQLSSAIAESAGNMIENVDLDVIAFSLAEMKATITEMEHHLHDQIMRDDRTKGGAQ